MKSVSLKLAVLALAVGVTACSKHESKKGPANGQTPEVVDPVKKLEENNQSREATMTEVFTKIDPTYDFNNRVLTDKIEGLELNLDEVSSNSSDVAFTGGLLIKGINSPIFFSSKVMAPSQAGEGKKVALTVNTTSQAEEVLGGPLSGSAQCLDSGCQKVAVYFRIYQGAGYIFENTAAGYKIVSSIGPAVDFAQAQAKRGRDAALSDKLIK